MHELEVDSFSLFITANLNQLLTIILNLVFLIFIKCLCKFCN